MNTAETMDVVNVIVIVHTVAEKVREPRKSVRNGSSISEFICGKRGKGAGRGAIGGCFLLSSYAFMNSLEGFRKEAKPDVSGEQGIGRVKRGGQGFANMGKTVKGNSSEVSVDDGIIVERVRG